MKNRRCLNLACPLRGKVSSRNIVRHGFYRTRSRKRRRYRCGECGKTFSSTKGTPYYRLQHRRTTFDGVIALRVEGVSISAISRIEGIAWNTVARWLEKAAQVCRRFNHRRIADFAAKELQADEIRTFVGNKKRRCCTARSKSLTSLCRLQSHPAQYVSGIPSAAILLSISHPIRCSTRCLANVRARISGPMIAL